jgi:hypothetical protein
MDRQADGQTDTLEKEQIYWQKGTNILAEEWTDRCKQVGR